jgi:hypothetical protein
MIIIIEGPDGAGKTTLAGELVDHFNLRYVHEGPPPQDIDPLEYYTDLLTSYRDDNIVFDRFALGERVYGPILRGTDRLTEEKWKIFRRLMQRFGAFHILCLPPYPVCYNSWSRKDRRELFQDVELFRQSWIAFQDFDAEFDLVYDYTVDTLALVINMINRHQRRCCG